MAGGEDEYRVESVCSVAECMGCACEMVRIMGCEVRASKIGLGYKDMGGAEEKPLPMKDVCGKGAGRDSPLGM